MGFRSIRAHSVRAHEPPLWQPAPASTFYRRSRVARTSMTPAPSGESQPKALGERSRILLLDPKGPRSRIVTSTYLPPERTETSAPQGSVRLAAYIPTRRLPQAPPGPRASYQLAWPTWTEIVRWRLSRRIGGC